MEKKVINNSTEEAKSKVPKPSKINKASTTTYSTGRRKTSVARVWLSVGVGKVIINKTELEQYFARDFHRAYVIDPLKVTKTSGHFDIVCTVRGGGNSGQAGAIRHGIACALDKIDSTLHTQLRQGGFLTRDSREVERKKYGRHKARKRPQFSKR